MRVFIPKFRSIHHVGAVLILIWICVFYFQERLVPYLTIKKCGWPILEDEPFSTKVLLVADPQLIDNHTYPSRNQMLLGLSKHTVDTYLKKNYQTIIRQLQPGYVVFLGDYLDNGRSSSDKYYERELRRFKRIFYSKFSKTYKYNEKFLVNTPGNHDIGFGDGVKLDSRQRFSTSFAPPNKIHTIEGVEFISLDTLSLSSTKPEINSESQAFLELFEKSSNPRILLSHVPLYRDKSLSCGPLREGVFNGDALGYQYKSTISSDITSRILEKIKPNLIFTGDDHDYCDIIHRETNSREIMVKSISMAMGIKYPAVQLLTFSNSNKFSYSTGMCYLPTPYINVIYYVLLSVFTGFVILIWNTKQKSARYNYSSILPMIDTETPSATAKKISNFLEEQELSDMSSPRSSSSYYLQSSNTLSDPRKSSAKFHNSKFGVAFYRHKSKMTMFLRRWNVISFLKHSFYMGLSVISIYYVGFCLTL